MMQRLAATLVALGLAACGSKEASQMEEWATKVCECQTLDCAKPMYEEAIAAAKANTGKSASKSAAEKYKNAGDKLTKCYTELLAKSVKPDDKKPDDKKPDDKKPDDKKPDDKKDANK